MQEAKKAIGVLLAVLALSSCGGGEEAVQTPAPTTEATEAAPAPPPIPVRFNGNSLEMPAETITGSPARNALRNAYFGDLHVHTMYSFDAYVFGTTAGPDDAYRYAKGEAIQHPAGFEVQLRQPLDFYAVTDHAMFLGGAREAANTETDFSKYEHVQKMHNLNAPENRTVASIPNRSAAFSGFLPRTLQGIVDGTVDGELVNNIAREAWSDIVRAAEQHNNPGHFTTFVAYEYTSSSDDRGNLHRNVVFRGADRLPSMPFSRFHSQDPEGLWDWMDNLREQGIETLAIPHNMNGSNGQMFKLVDWAGDPMDDDYADKRLRNEPIVELTQIKGTSETHPLLSDSDEWANFEIMPYRIATTLYSEPKGSYVREALLNGLAFEDRGVENPYRFGFIGSSDTHTAAISDDESNYFMKIGILDSTPALRGSVPLSAEVAQAALTQNAEAGEGENPANITVIGEDVYRTAAPITWGASGLAGVWAEGNTRDAIYDALRRRETFATSGTRIRVRAFAGYGFDKTMLSDNDVLHRAYDEGVPMGSELLADGDEAPRILAWATRDAMAAPLQRLQVIKGWTVNGEHQERVYDVACSDGGSVDPVTHRCPDNGAKVNLTDCSISTDRGAGDLRAVWQDPNFNPAHRAFYYARALENPTCRWSTWDALRAGFEPRPDVAKTIQERAWSSPIWYVPKS